jgi:Cu2+-exporting ATPase
LPVRQNLAWAIGYNAIALPMAAGALEPLGVTLSPAIGALAMSGSSVIVAMNAVTPRPRLPGQQAPGCEY